jgi:hypothetical protein
MLVEDVVHLARYGELSSVSIKDNTPAIVSFINLGLIELYKEFALNRSEVVITLEEGKTIYDMPSDYMYYTIAFEKVKKGNELVNQDVAVNDEQSVNGIFFPSFNKVQIPKIIDLTTAEERTEITIVYVTKPPTYTIDTIKEEIALPEVLIDCLLHYLGYKGHLGVKSDDRSENNSHFKRFERSISKAKEKGLCLSTDYYREVNKIILKGFV